MGNGSADIVSTKHPFPGPSHPQSENQEQRGTDEQHRCNRDDDGTMVVIGNSMADLDGTRWNCCHILHDGVQEEYELCIVRRKSAQAPSGL